MDTSIPALVLQGTRDPTNHGILGAIRSLGRFGVPVYALLGQRSPAIESSKYLRGVLTADLARTSPERVAELTRSFTECEHGPVLIPVDDVATMVIDREAALRAISRVPRVPDGVLGELTDKRRLTALAARLGIAVPAVRIPTSRAEMLTAAEEIGYPAVLKGADPFTLRAQTGAVSVRIVNSPAELTCVYDALSAPARANVLLQEYVAGDPAADWMFNGCFDQNSRCVFAGTGLKLRQWPVDTGAATYALSTANPVVEELSLRLAGAVAYAGMIDIDFRFDRRDGQYKLLDVNPRLGASFRLFVSDDGLDTVRAHYLSLSGQTVPPARARSGRKWLVEQRDLKASFRLMRKGRLGVRELVRSLADVDEAAWYDRDDAAPFLAMMRYGVTRFRQRASERD